MNPNGQPRLTVIDTESQEPRDPAALLERAKTLLAQGRIKESEDAFRQVAASPGLAAQGLYGIGLARLADGDLETAGPFFDQSLALDPANANALYQLGVIAEQRGHTAAARQDYYRALAIVPGHAGARRRLSAIASLPGATGAPPSGGAIGSASSGIVSGLRYHQEMLRRTPFIVWNFWLARTDSAGNPMTPIPVEMRARRIMGHISNGDLVDVQYRPEPGRVVQARIVRNMTTGANVTAFGTPNMALRQFVALLILLAGLSMGVFIMWHIWTFSASWP